MSDGAKWRIKIKPHHMEKIIISDAVSEDVLQTTRLLHETWLATYPNKEHGVTAEDVDESYKDSYTEENQKKRKERIKNLPKNERQITAKIGDKIVGVCAGIVNEDKNELKMLYVLPEYQGKGVGTALWLEIRKFFDPKKGTIVKLIEYNAKTKKFYEGLGFRDTGKRIVDERWRMKSGAIMPEIEMVIPEKINKN